MNEEKNNKGSQKKGEEEGESEEGCTDFLSHRLFVDVVEVVE
jgi:hypothetical protein